MKMLGWRKTRPVSLALQGGGAHGAFTWGVLDHLLEDGRVEFDGVSGTSAGAMNAVLLADGLQRGGRDGAREALARFWLAVSASLPFDLAFGWDAESVTLAPALKLMRQWSHYFSPYQLNPFDHNPLRDIVVEQIDFERLRVQSPVRLFIAATQANSGKLRLFRHHELTAEALLASACLPTLHHAVEIDGEPYWDGAYAANPAVFPLFYECRSDDIMLVLLTPLQHENTPRSAQEIRDRALEIAFSSSFLHEMRAFARLQAFARRQVLPIGRLERRLARSKFHVVDAQDFMRRLASETKLVAHLPFLESLRDLGREKGFVAQIGACVRPVE
ncbi:patatin-like phospholipase family protein [Crenobacter sp. SG2303]|uniref:Patatin-like phospholipase family protein n=1 Tax=Crenobacter oryzisoli TaxID=3056844 RepID=A0ABT7XI77_9NEIS|nr:patatin-like phospholipase family protein [Crenobacter sp. SG2303]MDN0073476.1 patatin-like phospholipase family protein [Crenobacter sp. SG2303]